LKRWVGKGKRPKTTPHEFSEIAKHLKDRKAIIEDRKELENLRAKLNPDEKNPGSPGPVSVNIHAWLDLATGAYDSHADQYMVIDGEAHCYDFARFCAPSEAYKDGDSLMMVLRSTFIDHPSCQEELPPEVIETILGVDVGSFEDNLAERGLIESRAYFDERRDGIRQANIDYASITDESITDERFRELCERYDVSPENVNAQQIVKKGLMKDYMRMKEESFSKIHPDALKGMIRRMEAGQIYIRSCQETGETPTMKGAFKAMMPAQATLHELYAKYSGSSPGNLMAYDKTGGVITPVDLYTWLDKIKDNMNSDDLAAALRAIAFLEEQSCNKADLCTTMDIGDI